MKDNILNPGEKVHVIHRRHLEKEPQRHFVGVVDRYDNGVLRATGYVYTVDMASFRFFRRPGLRTRIIAAGSGDVLINVLPDSVDIEKITYSQEAKAVRVTDGSDWFLDLSEFTWR